MTALVDFIIRDINITLFLFFFFRLLWSIMQFNQDKERIEAKRVQKRALANENENNSSHKRKEKEKIPFT